MKKINISVLFGSDSDASISSLLCERLGKIDNVEVDLQVISAHRNAQQLKEYLAADKYADKYEDKYDLYVAGAGLAAHLPGAIASLTARPVLGLPIMSCFQGFDAFLSIVQMPKDVPVLSYFPEDLESLARDLEVFTATKYESFKKFPILVTEATCQYEYIRTGVDEIVALAQEKGLDPEIVYSLGADKKVPGIHLVTSDEVTPTPGMIQIPVFEKSRLREAKLALDFFNLAHFGGGWVGVNRFENAFFMLEKLMNLSQGKQS